MHSRAGPSVSALGLLALAFSAAASSPPYGASPWLWYGSPAAPPAATVLSATGNARFTVLTPSLLRLERRGPGQAFVDAQSLAFWNRATPVPPFTAATTGAVTTIDTGLLLLTYTDDGAPFSDASLSVLRRAPAAFWPNASATWRPSQQASVDAGNLLGTFHTLDSGHNGYGGGLNCSLLSPDALGLDTVDFYPCDFGVISKSGFVLVDDSRTPVWDAGSGWLASRPGAQCAAAASAQACFPGGQDTSSSALCQAAGCCWDPSSVQEIQLFYSPARQDHFTDNLKCGACAGLDYVLLHSQGYVYTAPAAGRVPLNLYWNPSPSPLLRGATGDNVASSFPPAQPGYTQERVEGYVGDPALPQPPNTTLLKLFYSAAHLDHWTTAGAADEAAAAAAGYTLVGAVGYAPTAGSGSNSSGSALRCTAPAGPAYSSDAYLFAHGANYSAALADYVLVAGPVPIPRRHWLGVSWSTWDESNDAAGTQAQVAALQAGGWPVDTYIFDMQWHLRPGWGGYQWDQARYGDAGNVSALLAHLHGLGLATGMNLHDADGVSETENPQRWGSFASAMGLAPSATAAPFDIANATYANALHGVLLEPLLAQGLDICWTDFQQGVPGVDAVRGLVPTALLNHYRFYTCAPRAGMRGTLHSRYAGRGDHRHTSSFGGDVNESWESLRFMVDFTKTAANAPLCWWGHEMMRQGGGINDNSELFARTNQFGAWSPIFTSWGNGGENNIWWDMPEPFASATRLALVERLQLLPYRYTAAAAAAATGLCSHRGMHFDFPAEPDAYATPGQYMLGGALIVAPALAPVAGPPIPAAGGAGPFGTAGVSVWVPPGDWRDFRAPSAPLAQGWMTYAADIYTVPVLVRGGAAVPLLQLPANASRAAAALGVSARQYSALTWRVFPGAAAGAGEVYEDDGESTGYLTGASARTVLTYAAPPPPAATSLSIATTGAGYAGMVTQGRAYAVELLATSAAPARVVQNGVDLAQGSSGAPGTWERTAAGATVVRLFLCSTGAVQSVQVLYATE